MRLDLATRTLFAEFQERCFARAALERELHSSSVYVKKTIKGKGYWYIQQYVSGRMLQRYFGPANKKNNTSILQGRVERRKQQSLLKKLILQENRQAAMLRRGGLASLDARFAKIVVALSDAKLIDEGGVLIGSLAFQAYAGIVGALFDKALLRTEDLDLVVDASIKIIPPAPAVDVEKLFSQLGINVRAVPGLSLKAMPTSFISEDGIRIDLLTPLKGKPRGSVLVPGISGSYAQQLPFLDFLISQRHRTVLIGPSGGIPVQVPAPAHFALHKLIVAARRPVTEASKRDKDLRQVSELLRVLSQEYPPELRAAIKKVSQLGKKAQQAVKAMVKLLPEDVQEMLKAHS